MRLTLILGCALVLGTASANEPTKAAQKLASASSYTFSLTSKNATVPARHNILADGMWRKGQPLSLTALRKRTFQNAKGLVYGGGNRWTLFDPAKLVKIHDQKLRATLQQLRKLRAPHDEMTTLCSHLQGVAKKKKDIFTGRLDRAGAHAILVGRSGTGPVAAGHTGHAGTAEIRLAGGAVKAYTVTITWTEKHASHVGPGVKKFTWVRSVTFKKVGSTKYVVPVKAAKLLK